MFEMKCGDNGQYSKSKVERKFKEQYEAGVEQTWTSLWIFLFFFKFLYTFPSSCQAVVDLSHEIILI